MGFITMTTLAFGVVLSSVSGLICYVGTGHLANHLDWLPHANLLLSHPGAALGAGATLIVASLLFQPSRVE
ncbi:MAG: hypothetical protein JXQ75_17490 [Phycisphaerae bacterium]|nr:hypothetical protein [Phycisphaerae bacterium]